MASLNAISATMINVDHGAFDGPITWTPMANVNSVNLWRCVKADLGLVDFKGFIKVLIDFSCF